MDLPREKRKTSGIGPEPNHGLSEGNALNRGKGRYRFISRYHYVQNILYLTTYNSLENWQGFTWTFVRPRASFQNYIHGEISLRYTSASSLFLRPVQKI